jgi:hypothetical protein
LSPRRREGIEEIRFGRPIPLQPEERYAEAMQKIEQAISRLF